MSRLAAMVVRTRPAILLPLALGATLAALQPVAAQNLRGSVETGRRLASQWCSGCHSIEPKTVGIFAADFAEIAKLPSTTALSLKVFLQTSHRDMPNFILQPDEANDIVAYILSLKRK
jgi:mono/diheme cytochrome c family protein